MKFVSFGCTIIRFEPRVAGWGEGRPDPPYSSRRRLLLPLVHFASMEIRIRRHAKPETRINQWPPPTVVVVVVGPNRRFSDRIPDRRRTSWAR